MIYKGQTALSTPFDPGTSGMTSTNVQAGILENFANSNNTSKGYLLCSYGGNANIGRYLEFFPSIDSSIAPIYSSTGLKILTIAAATTAVNATCTIGFYNGATLLYTVTFSAVQQVVATGTSASPLLTLPAMGSLSIKVDTGSISKPFISMVAQGA